MKRLPTFSLLLIIALSLPSCAVKSPQDSAGIDQKDISGAWVRQLTEEGVPLTQVLLFEDGFYTWTSYRTEDGAFRMTKGGKYRRENAQLIMDLEFHSSDPDQVGSTETFPYQFDRGQINLFENGAIASQWSPIDVGQQTALTGAWLFAGREQEGQMQRREPDQPRKTMKMLTGKRFQWIAYDTDTKQFYGTGGGTYTARNGNYVETILFFSRDDSRVGRELPFSFDVKEGEWHHSGQSSSGDPMYEIWAPRAK